MINLTGARGRGFTPQNNASESDIREEMLKQLNLCNTTIAEVKSSISAFQSLSGLASDAASYINSDTNIPNSTLQGGTDVLNQMEKDLNTLNQSITYLENLCTELERAS